MPTLAIVQQTALLCLDDTCVQYRRYASKKQYQCQKFFQDQIGQDTITKIKKITFCGNDGDPIYCREFLEIVKYLDLFDIFLFLFSKNRPRIPCVLRGNA
jgi:hypothetical protein